MSRKPLMGTRLYETDLTTTETKALVEIFYTSHPELRSYMNSRASDVDPGDTDDDEADAMAWVEPDVGDR